MTRHRGRGRRRGRAIAVAVVVLAIGLGVLALPFVWPGDAGRSSSADRIPPLAPVPGGVPTRRATPKYLTTTYRAPPRLVRAGVGGVLRIPSLGVRVPVDAVGMDGTAMAVPDDPSRVGWLSSTAKDSDVVGSSVLAGHVSDPHDRPGALHDLGQVHIGAVITWTERAGTESRFTVVRLQRFRRDRGLPASMFSAIGPHELHLVTCAGRVSTPGGGFHYTQNLVVTAVR